MQVEEQDVRLCLDKAREVTDQYKSYVLAGDHVPRTTEDLVEVMRQLLHKKFVLRRLHRSKSSIKAIFLATQEDVYEIYLLEGMDTDEERFALTKELFHILIDHDESRSMDVTALIVEVTKTWHVHDSNAKRPVVWELLAEVAALEFLFPYEHRVASMNQAGGPDFANIAQHYGVPQAYVERYCSPFMMDELGKCHDSL